VFYGAAVIVLVLGGARSGKSELAEQWVERLGSPVTYVATGWNDDDAMAARIEAHRVRRPASWATLEVGTGLAEALRSVHGAVLVDALGTWLARHRDFEVDAGDLCRALQERDGDTVVVSDEVGLGVHPETAVGLAFRDALGSLNRAVAGVADRAVLVVAGRVLELDRWDGGR
jgi:adenosyl cobinamide kinase/adenosyl cobinamide phosphate guanylyltransferase